MFLFDEIFLKLFNLSVTASWLILAVLVFRFILKKAPKWINCMLWLLVAVRLVCPFSFESILSLVPSSETITEQNFYYSSTPTISSGVEAFNRVVNPIISESLAPDPSASVNPTQILGFTLGVIWLLGALLMLLYAVISYIKLRKQVRTAIPLNENQWICDEVKSPFILGVFRPRIYLPSDLTGETLKHVIAHEKAHLKRKDHLWKPIGFILLSVYWFNPLMWLSYILLCRDIELACDEKVIKQMEGTDKKAYSEALLSCSVPQRMITVCPVAFGEVGVKQRIKSVLSYKKPAFWVILIAVVASIVVAVCFMTDPVDETNGGEDMYTWGVDEIDEDNFKMNEIMADVHTYTVKKGDNDYFDATEGNGLGEVSVFLDSLMLGKTTNKNVDYSLVDGCIVANSEKYGKVEIYFAENYSRLWLRSLSDTSESFVYVVLSVEKARDFFNDEEYTDSDTVWEYNPSMSSYGHGTLQIIIDADYESFEAECEYGEFQFISYDGMGMVHSDGFGKSVVCTENDNLVWRPDNERMQNSNGEEIRIKVNLKNGKTEEFRILLERVRTNSLVSTYFKVSAGNVPVYKDSVGAFRFYLSEKLTWLYNPYAGATWWYITRFSLPEGYSIQSAECTDGEASVEDKYYSDPEGEKCVLWSPDSTNVDTMTFADLTVHALYNGEKVDFTVRIKRLGEELMGTVFSIEPLNCKITVDDWTQYVLEPLEEETQSISDFNDEFDLYDTWIEEKYIEFIPNDDVAEVGTEEYLYKIHENGYAEITSYIGTDSVVTIPAYIDGFTVAYIGESAFEESNIVSVTMPKTIIYISEFAFSNCVNLKTVEFSESLLAIGSHAFGYCVNLENLKLPDRLEYIGVACFEECEKLSEVLIPSSVLELDNFCFMGCFSLKTVEFENGIQYIKGQAFSDTAIEKIILPSSLIELDHGCFMRCYRLSEVIFPTHMDNLLIIGSNNFMYCRALKKIEIPDNVVSIGSEAFDGCKKLQSIVIPKSVETIGHFAFARCNNLRDIYFESADCDIGIQGFKAITFTPINISAPAGGSVQQYANETPGVEFRESI